MYPTPNDYVAPTLNALGNREFIYGPLLQNLYGNLSVYLGRVFPESRKMFDFVEKFVREKSALYPKMF